MTRDMTDAQRRMRGPKNDKATDDDTLLIKHKLGLSKWHPIPKCPAKVRSVIKTLEADGDFSHSDRYPPDETGKRARKAAKDYHFACPVCGCNSIAGGGTKHKGWGWCHRHEKGHRQADAEAFAEAHLVSLQQHNPRHYLEYADIFDDIIKKGKAAELSSFDLTAEVSDVRSFVQSFYASLSDWEKTKHDAKPIVEAIEALREQVEAGGLLSESVLLELENIKTRVECPLTERLGNQIIPMTDKSKLTLSTGTLRQLAQASKDLFALKMVRAYSAENLSIWMMRLAHDMEKTFSEHTIETDNGTFKILELVCKCFADVGNPKMGL